MYKTTLFFQISLEEKLRVVLYMEGGGGEGAATLGHPSRLPIDCSSASGRGQIGGRLIHWGVVYTEKYSSCKSILKVKLGI